MKSIAILVVLLVLTAKGCLATDETDFILTQSGDTIYKQAVIESWNHFKATSDSTRYAADKQILAAVKLLGSRNTSKKVVLTTKILHAERLLERLSEKRERGQRFEIDKVYMEEKDVLQMEAYKSDYKKLEAKLQKAVENLTSATVEK